VDLITSDASVPLRQAGGVINEVNTTPALHHHYDRAKEQHPEAAVRVLRALLSRKASWVESGARHG
jgi:D-alanine-D-alanine ligase-like ATP-grasp enzyme